MEKHPSAHPCSFYWEINNPFIPWRKLEATFYHGFPSVTQWKVTLQPLERTQNLRKFAFSLAFDTWFARRKVIVAERILIVIDLDGKQIARMNEPYFAFHQDNRYTYNSEWSAEVYPQNDPRQLVVKIEFSLRGRNAGNEVEKGLFAMDDDLKVLSGDLKQLLKESKHSNMNLLPKDSQEPIKAHSYILDARWDNFFCLHAFIKNSVDTVVTNISRDLLLDILTYMYSGVFDINDPDRATPSYMAELFQVIERYKLYHLYRLFAKSDMKQARVSSTPVHIESCLIRLRDPNDQTSHPWRVNPKPEIDIVFKISVMRDDGVGPWISYSLCSNSPSRVYGELNLELIRRRKGSSFRSPVRHHERYFVVDPGSTVTSKTRIFFGYFQTFGDLDSNSTSTYRCSVRCFLSLTDGTTVERIRNIDDDRLQRYLERFQVLSDHMYTVRNRKVDTDMHIICRSVDLPCKVASFHESIHKGIFASRVREFLKGLESVPEEVEMPDVARTTLNCLTLRVVLDYMYTGKLLSLPFAYSKEIKDFAKLTGFTVLEALIDRIHTCYED